jgi:3-hydroxybutyryl-CoA dehydrogenase
MRKLKKVGVIGAGMMGAEIAFCFAVAKYKVIIKDATLELSKNGKKRLEAIFDKGIKKGKFLKEEKNTLFSRIIPSDKYDGLEDCDLIIEAVFEDVKIKKNIFSHLDSICKPDCVFATNTSSIPVTLLATAVKSERIGSFLGTHFFSPASVMKLVEVIPGLETEEETTAFMMECCKKIEKTPIRVKDVAGFAVNRILHAMWIEANRLVEEGVATPEDIDTACKLGLGHPIGPYALMDLTSNDLNFSIQKILYDTYGERFRPRPILKQKVDANHLGRKAGKGWFIYNK